MVHPSLSKIVLALAFMAGGAAFAGQIVLAPGDTAPRLKGYLPDGNFRTVDYGPNALTLVNFWASWCEPCRREMPLLDELQRRYADQGLEVIGVWDEYMDTDPEAVTAFLAAVPVDYVILRAHREVRRIWPAHGITPTTYLINADGRIVRRYVGATEEQTEGLAADLVALFAGEPMPVQIYPKPTELPEEFGTDD